MKLTIVQAHDAAYTQIANECCPSVEAYALKHGYNYARLVGPLGSKSVHLDKLVATKLLMPSAEFVWYIDPDAMIVNQDIDIADVIDTTYPVNVCNDGVGTDPWNVNVGVIVWRSCKWVRSLLDHVLEIAAVGESDQPVIQWKLKEPEIAENFKQHPSDCFNHKGTFVRHFCDSQDLDEKLRIIREYKQTK